MSSEHNQHYAPNDAEAAVAKALTALGSQQTTLSPETLAALDQFHTGGIEATRTLAQRAGITASDRILDVGGGLGGPARVLAHEIGCHVTVLDLTEAYCRIGEQLTAHANLTDRVRFQQGNALDLPYEQGSFDLAWTQHSSMNIADKAGLYAQIQRVVRPGGRLAFFEVAAGSGEALHFPTMWAHTQASSFLLSPEVLRATVAAAGFREVSWEDKSAWSIAWFQERQRAQQAPTATPNPFGLQLLLGADTGTMLRNHVGNLQAGRIRIIEAIFERI